MDTEKSSEVSDTVMEKEAALKEATPENPPAAEEEPSQSTVNGLNSDGPETGNVTPPEEKPEAKGDDSSAKEAHESSEKISDPVETPENTKQPPVPENEPEPLAKSNPEPEPEKSAESVPEAEPREQTSPEPAAVQQPVDSQPPSQEDAEKGPETTMEPKTEAAAAPKEAEVVAEPEEAKAAAEPKEAGEATGTVLVTEPATVKVEEPKANEKPEDKGAEAAAEPEQKEDPTPASGSLSFALLEQQQTKDALRISRTLVVLRGLPGSGKSFLARAIGDAYQDHCCVISADDHGIKPESPSADGYKALDDAVVARCSDAAASTSVLIVVDDTNHTQDRLARLGEIAEQNHLVAIFLQTQTQWSRDVPELSKKSKRGLQEAQLEAMKAPLEEVDLPLFFGWFLLSSVQEKVRCTSMDFLKTLDTLEAFKKHLVDFTGKAENEVDLEQYFKPTGALHCTTKFCNYGKAEGAKEYAENPAVRALYGSAFELSLTALFVTPRTVGARVSLTDEQLKLWPADAEQSSAASLPPGSRAHITLGCAEGVEPVQTGVDLLEILALQQDGQQGEPAEEMELGSLTYYGEGRWLLNLREPIGAPACFSSFYGRKESEPAKKEPEKKKKPKCAIL
ncbi:2',3'-cyclic-nucleotide 3'-phosphodiesterase [Acanthochromis polyacanthus]|uniref:2',3'-cyclic-nucleotide 3'-phosphodiesterase n=1 Tax=Acanthochromis polyacanthus TaxID=80966 RepID=UPI0022346837|nr:2',3'-cyclic-nucleotide 3'-phosphodiesterase [Acanthochromis polyacanthus]XP_022049292.2 2',3'-cyclic-nucleotide 3'-phosphodiesterase [Acanthochromis polyacanthus]